MSWSYLIVFNNLFASRQELTDFLSTVSEVTYWYACLPNCVFVTSTVGANELAKRLEERFGTSTGKRFLVTEVHTDRQGRLPKKAWHMLNNPDNPRLPE